MKKRNFDVYLFDCMFLSKNHHHSKSGNYIFRNYSELREIQAEVKIGKNLISIFMLLTFNAYKNQTKSSVY